MDLGSLLSGAGNAIKGLFTGGDGNDNPGDVSDTVNGISDSIGQLGNSGSTAKPSMWGNLLKTFLAPAGLSALGKGLGGTAQAEASNRGAKLTAMMAGDNAKLQQQQQRMNDLATLPGQIQKADYLSSGGYTPKANISASGRTIPKFDLGLAPISDNVKKAGSTLEGQLMNRLNTPPTYNDYSSVMNPSATESVLNVASPVLSALGAAKTAATDPYTQLLSHLFDNQNQAPTTPIPTAPKPIALPYNGVQ